MGIKVTWPPIPDGDIAAYKLERADNLTGAPWQIIAIVENLRPGPHYDSTANVFFYVDPSDDPTRYYRLSSIDSIGQESAPSQPFQPAQPIPPPNNYVKLDHNYGGPGTLRYQTAAGVPIELATVRLYYKLDFDQGRTDLPLAITQTDLRGNWVNPVNVRTGYTYVIQFAKEGLYGPDKVEVVV